MSVLILAILTTIVSSAYATPSQEYKYYFYAPANQLLLVVGFSDNTLLKLYRLSKYGLEKSLMWSGSVDRMSKVIVPISKGFYVLYASNRAGVALCTDWNKTKIEGGFFYPATTGNFVGKEFIFVVFDYGEGIPTVYAFEDADVKVYDYTGKLVEEFTLWQNDTRTLHLFRGSLYRVTSTGRIAILQMSDDRMVVALGPYGNFKGTWLIGGTHHSCGIFAVMAYDTCEVVVEDARRKIKLHKHVFTSDDVKSNKPWSVVVRLTLFLKFSSNSPITALVGEDDDELDVDHMIGVAIAGVKGGEEFRIYAPSGLVIFALENCEIEVNNALYTVSEGQYLIFNRGAYTIKSNRNLIIEIIGNRGPNIYSASVLAPLYLLSDKDVDLNLPPPKQSKKEFRSTIDYNLIIVVTVMVLLALIAIKVFLSRRRSS